MNETRVFADGYRGVFQKLLKTVCRGDYNEKCAHCESYRKYREGQELPCEKKNVKRQNIQRGCRKLAEICRELELPMSRSWSLPARAAWENPWAVRSCFTFGPMMFLDVPFQ